MSLALPNILLFISSVLSVLVMVIVIYCWRLVAQLKFLESTSLAKESELRRKVYEATILRQVNQRVGYSLDFEKIIEIISGSLGSLIPYSTISYTLIKNKHLLLRTRVEEEVGQIYLQELKKKTLESLVALDNNLGKDYQLEEIVTGEPVSRTGKDRVQSYFHIPLILKKKVYGVMTIASIKPSLYKEDDMTIMYQIVDQASSALVKLEGIIESEKSKIQSVIESLHDGVLMVTPSKELLVYNPAANRYLSLPEDPTFTNVVSALGNAYDFEARINECLTKKIQIGPLETSPGNFYLDVFISPVLLEDEVLGAVALLSDKTQEKELEKLRDQFTTMVIHDLRTPLSIIFGTADLLLKRDQDLSAEKKASLLGNVHLSAERMLDQVSNLLDVAKIDAEKWQITKKKVDILSLVREKYEFFSPLASEKKIIFQMRAPDSLTEIDIDKEQIGRVLENILGNAFKFTHQGKIILGVEKNNSAIEIYVQDTGEGIAEEQQKYLFSKFGQLQQSLNSDSPGSGLGLAICKGIIEAHGGTISVKSHPTEGSTFRFSLPL